ncbi:hypothetical protein BDN70DRAFT_995196 [Pholiota conissans]|uniref:Uncharacterized protein n=1 Tax=Pholiota conissans TaxID=109636 RepID=A0A9P6CYA7_9AGAR|nr:hypothetical protein BDN70DRAFT_995196 [Pholiota conissans]
MSSDLNATALHAEILSTGITVNDEISLIATNLHVAILQGLLMGIYTVIFGGTMYAYLTRESSKRYLVPITVSLLYLSNLATFGLNWYSTKFQFVNNGEDRDTVFLATFNTQQNIAAADLAFNIVSLVLGDALLIWRCFNLWNRSIRVISIPVFLTIAEAALMLNQVIGDAIIFSESQGRDLEHRLSKAASAGILTSACTTIITTFLITYRIHSFLKNQHISSRKFRHIIDIVVQSGAISSITILVFGISQALPTQVDTANIHGIIFNFWMSTLVFPIAAISTTVMVARVATLSGQISNPATSVHLTGLQFQPHSTTYTATGAQLSVAFATHGGNLDGIRDLTIEGEPKKENNTCSHSGTELVSNEKAIQEV